MLPLSILAADLHSVRAIRNSSALQLTLNIINSPVFHFCWFSSSLSPLVPHRSRSDTRYNRILDHIIRHGKIGLMPLCLASFSRSRARHSFLYYFLFDYFVRNVNFSFRIEKIPTQVMASSLTICIKMKQRTNRKWRHRRQLRDGAYAVLFVPERSQKKIKQKNEIQTVRWAPMQRMSAKSVENHAKTINLILRVRLCSLRFMNWKS